MHATQPEKDPPILKRLTLKEAASEMGVSTATIRRRIKDGSLRAYQKIGRFGSQWMVSESDLGNVVFPQEDHNDALDDIDEGEDPEAPPPLITPDQAPPNGVNSEVYDCEEFSLRPHYQALEQQALHQAGYWKGRWDESRDRVIELERQLSSLPLAQLTEQAQSSKLAEEKALSEMAELKAQLIQATSERADLKVQLEHSQRELTVLRKKWWRRLFSS